MPMEAAAVDKLVEKGEFRPQVAQAIAEAIDITIKAANFVTVPVLDARFALFKGEMEARFGAIEKSIEATKVWAALLYAGLTIALFSALAVDHHWLVSREDQLMARSDASLAALQARSDKGFAELQTRIDKGLAELQARSDKGFAELQTRVDKGLAELQARRDRGVAKQHE